MLGNINTSLIERVFVTGDDYVKYKECCLIEEQEEKKEIKTQKTKIVKRPLSNGYIDARYNNHPELLRH